MECGVGAMDVNGTYKSIIGDGRRASWEGVLSVAGTVTCWVLTIDKSCYQVVLKYVLPRGM